ncbi:hypothetical protein [Candidatus Vampirococcus lugosii]|uniref:CRISPR system ring nuclease SSO1393-like domain-containing protein n=1 Tax=Candidatus Vampirococcus lugosii TaxID=2789015 RepID=A0ABS5QKF0_9BACT|nr:hypothetical protein [Candidatus Vampirococcus lugosii]MBS8121720.1 hypothetical protein [Candidatus Vampirococcus lugosii]
MKKEKVLLIWSFGTSDIYLDGKLIRDNFLSKTKDIAKNFDTYYNEKRINMSILENFVNEFYNNKEIIIKGIFTDQNGFEQDTIYLQTILMKYIQKGSISSKIKSAREHIILDEARRFDIIKNKLDSYLKNIPTNIFEEIMINNTSGTKGLSSALLFSSLLNFELGKLSFYYGEQIDKDTLFMKQSNIIYFVHKQNIDNFLENKDFESCISYLQNNNLISSFKKEFDYSKYMFARINADYDKCKEIYKKGNLDSKFAITKNTVNKIQEMINGIIFTFDKKRFIEFLGRIYNFTDVGLRFFINKFFETDFESIKYKDLQDFVQKYPDLEKFLNNYKVRFNNKASFLNWNIKNSDHMIKEIGFINTKVMLSLLDFISTKNGEYKKYKDFFVRLEKLNEYRNNTLIAHGMNQVNEKIIFEKYGYDTIKTDFIDLLENIVGKNKLWIEF